MTNSPLIILLVILVLLYLLSEKKSYPGLPVPKPISRPKEVIKSYQKPKVNREEDDLPIIPPDISYHPARIQTLLN